MKVLHFGCGGGYLLPNIDCQAKLGLEVNPVARAEANNPGVVAVGSAAEVEDNWAGQIRLVSRRPGDPR
jgi:hypothetical protein